jgi:histidine phosphotransferase ChpT
MLPLAFLDHRSDLPILDGDINDVVAMQLISSRICHDLSGPGGAVAAAMEIMGDPRSPDPDALQIIAESAEVFRNRLSFLRTAFGFGGAGSGGSSLSQAVAIAVDSFHGTRIEVQISPDERQPADMGKARSADVVRLLLCLTSEVSHGLPRGGTIDLRFTEFDEALTIDIGVRGKGARFPNELKFGIDPTVGTGLTSRNVSVYYLHKLLAKLGTSITFSDEGEDEPHATVIITIADA